MLIFGLLLLIGAAGAGGWLGWENRHAIVHVRIDAHHVWTGHLYALLIVGVLLTCWFLLGASLIRCRIAERRQCDEIHPIDEIVAQRLGQRQRQTGFTDAGRSGQRQQPNLPLPQAHCRCSHRIGTANQRCWRDRYVGCTGRGPL